MTHAGSSHELPLLSGPTPGLLDPSQRSRLLRTPTCSLFFAAFDPLTARSDTFPNLSALHIDPGSSSKRVNLEATANTNGKRVVIETDPENGTCSWRFVPRARTDGEALGDEAPWPKVVELCGRLVRMTQDQWDIHKLDPEYDCLVRPSPSVAKITRIVSTTTAVESDPPSTPDLLATPKMTPASLDDVTPTPKPKRTLSPIDQDSDSPRKRKKTKVSSSQDSDRMAVDEDVFYAPPKATAADVANGKKRRRVSVRSGDASTSDVGKMHEGPAGKRRASPVFTDLSSTQGTRSGGETMSDIHDHEVPPTPAKRARTRSPEAVRREMEQKRAERERKRKVDMEMRVRERRDANHRAFWKEIGIFPVPEIEDPLEASSEADASERSNNLSESAGESEDDGESERLSTIEESRRKLAELEKDKPLWEESARKRQDREAEEERRRQRAKAMREEEERTQERVRAARRQRDERWEQERQEREREARVREQSGRMFVHAPRSAMRWNARFSLERYVRTAADFDVAKFSFAGKPMAFASVPWPMLHASFSVQDVDWDAVEAFFGEVERLLKPAEFKDLVEKSHRRFHPDRWRGRGLLVSVRNETERDLLEVAGSTVAQAITPLWKDVTGR